MKKFIFPLLLLAAVMFSSCNTQFGLVYNLSISGDGDGQFEVTFPQGSYAMDGTASLALLLGDTLPFNSQEKLTFKQDVLARNSKKELTIMQAVNDSIANKFSATAGSGTYDILIKGVVTEICTGLKFSVNRRITNRDIALRKANSPENVFCPFIE